MEILTYLRIIKKRLLVLLLVPVVAALLAVAYLFLTPAQYTATATVSTNTLVGGPTSFYSGPQGINQFVSSFTATALGPAVINQVSAQTKISATDLRDRAEVDQKGASSDMTVIYTSPNKDEVQPALTGIAAATIKAMYEPRVTAAQNELTIATDALKKANESVAAAAQTSGAGDPTQAYQTALNQVASLQQQQAVLRANGNAVGAATLDAPIAAAQDQLNKLGTALQGFNNVSAVQRAAGDDLVQAQADLRHATGELQAAQASNVTFVAGTAQVTRTTEIPTLVLPVFAAGIFLAIVLVLVLEMLADARRAMAASDAERDGGNGPGAEPKAARRARTPKKRFWNRPATSVATMSPATDGGVESR